MGVYYCTRESVKQALDVKETARSNAQIDDAIEAASRDIENNRLHRIFYPLVAVKKFDFPSVTAPSWPWVLWLDDQEVISVTSITSGGVVLPAANYILRPDNQGPPYDRIEINISSQSAFSIGATYQQSIVVNGLFGYSVETAPAGALTANISTTSTTTCNVMNSAAIGVGTIIQIDNERLIVTAKTMLSTGQTGSITSSQADTGIAVSDGTAFTVGETLLLDTERISVVDIAANVLIVKRAWDGTPLAAHSSATIYAPRTLTVARGALGTTAATHTSATAVLRHVVPGPVATLCRAEALNTLLQEEAGYARTVGSGDNVRNASGAGLSGVRADAVSSYGRKLRFTAV
jgi:hypothetical protein